VLPLCDCKVGEVVSGGFQGPFVRAIQGSASEPDSASAREPLGPSGNSSLPAAAQKSVAVELHSCANVPRDRDASLFALENPLPIALLPHIPLDGCHEPPLPKVCPRVDD
jgi:hypothetical protein